MRFFNAATGMIAGLGAGTANAGGPVIIEEKGAPEQAVAPSWTGVKPVFVILGVAAALPPARQQRRSGRTAVYRRRVLSSRIVPI